MTHLRGWPCVLAVALLAACAPPAFLPGPSVEVGESPSGEVAAVLFLVGDAGQARVEWTPLVHHLRDQVEAWSEELPGDTSVAVVYLGDNVYPVGLRPRPDEHFSQDSARLMAQVWPVAGPHATEDGVPAFFLPGNHDWGSTGGWEGRTRLAHQEGFLAEVSQTGPAVSLVPGDLSESPTVVEMGDTGPRLVLLDTQWWLQSDDEAERARLLDGLRTALRDAGERPVVVAAHHPYRSGGPHAERGLLDPFGLLARSGAIVQDLNAPPYAALRDGLEEVFAEVGRPLIYAGGHDHSLQVFRGEGADTPRWSLVSGAASKRSSVTEVPGLVWAGLAPGYMRLVIRTDGSVDLYVEKAPERFLSCAEPVVEREACLAEGRAAFRTTFSRRLR